MDTFPRIIPPSVVSRASTYAGENHKNQLNMNNISCMCTKTDRHPLNYTLPPLFLKATDSSDPPVALPSE